MEPFFRAVLMADWHRFRLLACIVVMLGMLIAGSLALGVCGVPERPFGLAWWQTATAFVFAERSPDALLELKLDFDVANYPAEERAERLTFAPARFREAGANR